MPTELRRAQFVFVRRDAHKTPLQTPYTGPFRVLEAGAKSFLLAVGGRQDHISIDKLKPARLDPVLLQPDSLVIHQESSLSPVVPSMVPTFTQPSCATLPPASPPVPTTPSAPLSPLAPRDCPSASPDCGSPKASPASAGYHTRSGRLVKPPQRLTYHVHVDSGGAYVAGPLQGDQAEST